MTPAQHLAHLIGLLQPPYTQGWSAHVKARAQELAAADKDCAHLPGAVLAEFRRLRKPTSSVTEGSGMPAEQPKKAGS